jgi:hypothetical protein
MNQLRALRILKKLKPRQPQTDPWNGDKPTGYSESDYEWLESNRTALLELIDALDD